MIDGQFLTKAPGSPADGSRRAFTSRGAPSRSKVDSGSLFARTWSSSRSKSEDSAKQRHYCRGTPESGGSVRGRVRGRTRRGARGGPSVNAAPGLAHPAHSSTPSIPGLAPGAHPAPLG